MSRTAEMEPRFPLRIIYDDGQMQVVDSPDALVNHIGGLDTTIELGHVWVRDELGRTVRLRVASGEVQVLEVLNEA